MRPKGTEGEEVGKGGGERWERGEGRMGCIPLRCETRPVALGAYVCMGREQGTRTRGSERRISWAVADRGSVGAPGAAAAQVSEPGRERGRVASCRALLLPLLPLRRGCRVAFLRRSPAGRALRHTRSEFLRLTCPKTPWRMQCGESFSGRESCSGGSIRGQHVVQAYGVYLCSGLEGLQDCAGGAGARDCPHADGLETVRRLNLDVKAVRAPCTDEGSDFQHAKIKTNASKSSSPMTIGRSISFGV